MKLKNAFLALTVIGLLFSCTNEVVLEGPDGSKAIDGCVATTAELTLNMGKVVTKAEDGYIAATAEELSVSKGYVAVFALEIEDGETVVKEMLGEPQYFETKAADLTTTDKNELKIAYTVPGIPVTTGIRCRILVIANTTLDLSELKTYNDFFSKVEAYEAATDFADDNLVKVGYSDATLTLKNRSVEVAMTQLAAKVNIKIQMGKDWPAAETDGSNYTWTFEPTSGFTVSNINTETDLMLVDEKVNSQLVERSLPESSKGEDEEWSNSFTFYTYEKVGQTGAKDLEVRVKGKIHQYKGGVLIYSQEVKEYGLTLNANTVSNWDGFRHGNYYDVVAKVSPSTMQIEYELTVLDWGTGGDIKIEPYYLYVDKLSLLMACTEDHSVGYTTFPSLTGAFEILSISELVPNPATGEVSEEPISEESLADLKDKILISATDDNGSGTIDIFSPLPTNYVGRKFVFVVENEKGLTQQVEVYQYPAFYISSYTTGSNVAGTDGQTNHSMYIFNSLVSTFESLPEDYTGLKFNDYYTTNGGGNKNIDKENYTENNINRPAYKNGHTTAEDFQRIANMKLNYLRTEAVSGYPQVMAGDKTVNSEENNRRVSPKFMLASQAGITGRASYSAQQDRCANYSEKDEQGNNYTDWRMPTLAELHLIDVLQNIDGARVTGILEGPYYYSAYCAWGEAWKYANEGNKRDTDNGFTTSEGIGGAMAFMDNRVRDFTRDEMRAPVRCVRDMK
ncbi:hypothetical protein [Parabacteroides sp. PF5-6]|uniref:fimbrial tip adhesin FimD n=1 Tax=Parabacteroides sp. PF5-6 TaxID=1742403 RepID=UPI002405B9D0|nr:hypothetical protein [Parabacteroides sp. PF5-6]MDF9829904.1 hypothetical protein [Parabacteroides sp. PF5-6]